MRKLVWLSWHSNPYNDYLFSDISKNLDVDLEVYYVKKTLSSHPWSDVDNYSFDYDHLRTTLGLDISFLRKCALSKDSYFLIAGWNHPTMLAALTILSLLRKPFALWSDTPDVLRKRQGFKSKLRGKWLNYVWGKMDHFLATGTVGVNAFNTLGVPKEKLVNFPFATDIDFFKPMPDKSPRQLKPLQLVTSGRLVNSHKGHDLTIHALSRFSDLNFEFRIAGVGPDEEKLTDLVKELGMEKKVIFEGWKEIRELPGFYNSAHAYIHTSHFDPFPNSVMEAMACGLPVIGSDRAGSVVDRVVQNVNGYVHKSGDVDDIAEKFQTFLDNLDRLEEMKINARKTAEKYPVENNLKIVNQLLKA